MGSDWQDQTIDVNGSRFHYTRTGGGDKPVLVLNHGFSDNGLCWARVARELEGEYDSIMPDARGHGLSARVQPGEVFDRTEDMANLLRALHLQRPIVAGHSLGAAISAQLAALYPDLLRALILEDPPWREDDAIRHEISPRPHLAWLASIAGKSAAELLVEHRAQNPAYPEIERPAWAESKAQFDQNLLRAASTPFMDWRQVAPAIQCPTLLITSDVERGGIVSPAVAGQAAARNPLMRPVTIPDAGHNIRRDNYAAFLSAMREFLAEAAA